MFVPPADQISQVARACVHIIATCRRQRGQYVVGTWSVCGRYVVGTWSVRGRYVVSMLSVCGRYVVGTWLVCGRYVVGMWSVWPLCDRYVVGMWSVRLVVVTLLLHGVLPVNNLLV